MNKSMKTVFQSQVLAGILVFMLAGCAFVNKFPNPVLVPIATAPYIKYTSSQTFNIDLEFEYPSSWIFSEEEEAVDIVAISLKDPRFLNLPTPIPPDLHPILNDVGSIVIWVTNNSSGITPESKIEMLSQNYAKLSRITILDRYEIEIDGYNASVLEYVDNEPVEGYRSLMFNRRIYFVVNNQMYEILFSVAEKDRGGDFEKGYEYFFDSLKIVPYR